MAEQSFTPDSYSAVDASQAIRLEQTAGNRGLINDPIAGGNPRYYQFLQMANVDSSFPNRLTIAGTQTEGFISFQELSDLFETNGSITVEVNSLSVTVTMDGADIQEPYELTPTSEVQTFVDAVIALSPQPVAADFTITLRDFVPPTTLDAAGTLDGELAGSLEGDASLGPEPISTSDWDGTGYQAPIILGVFQASITNNFLTDVDASPVEGEWEVAADLTFGRIERRPAPRLYRAAGSTARGDAYFDTTGSPMYPDAELFIQTAADGVARYQIAGSGNNVNWVLISGEPTDVLADIVDGDRFLLAIAEPTPPTPLDAAGTLAGALAGSLSGAASLASQTPLNAAGTLDGGLAGSLSGAASIGLTPALNAAGTLDGGLAGSVSGAASLGPVPLDAAGTLTGGLTGSLQADADVVDPPDPPTAMESWLRSLLLPWDELTGRWATALALADTFQGLIDAAEQARHEWSPVTCRTAALPAWGRTFTRPRREGESTADYRRRLALWRDEPVGESGWVRDTIERITGDDPPRVFEFPRDGLVVGQGRVGVKRIGAGPSLTVGVDSTMREAVAAVLEAGVPPDVGITYLEPSVFDTL